MLIVPFGGLAWCLPPLTASAAVPGIVTAEALNRAPAPYVSCRDRYRPGEGLIAGARQLPMRRADKHAVRDNYAKESWADRAKRQLMLAW